MRRTALRVGDTYEDHGRLYLVIGKFAWGIHAVRIDNNPDYIDYQI